MKLKVETLWHNSYTVFIPAHSTELRRTQGMPSRLLLLVVATAMGLPVAFAADYAAPAPLKNTSQLGHGIQRTMGLLASSTSERRNKVKILYYGQSITAASPANTSHWSNIVSEDLKRRFPHADITFQNKAISGFSSQRLYRTLEYDIIPEYPDMIIFHVYGAHTCYEEFVSNIRRRTTAEFAIWTDHVGGDTPLTPEGEYVDQGWTKFMARFIPAVAKQYGCSLMEIREPWKRYLLANELPSQSLRKDGVHLNDHGNWLLGELIKRELVHNPKVGLGVLEGKVKTYVVGRDVKWIDGKLELPFEGNRVQLIPTPVNEAKAPVNVAIDGMAPSTFPGCYAHTRPEPRNMMKITFKECPLVEQWTLKLTGLNPEGGFTFDLTGSRTGPDGSGVTKENFVSNSGRVVIEAKVKPPQMPMQSDWYVFNESAVGREIKWKTLGTFMDRYEPPAVADTTREHAATVAQGFPLGKHTLTLTTAGDGTPGIHAIRAYCPPTFDQHRLWPTMAPEG